MAVRPDIPSFSKSQLGDNARPMERIREELQTLLGLRGDPLDQAITVRGAIERGLIDLAGRALAGGTINNTFPPSGPGGTGTGTEPDLTPPPTPTGLTLVAGFTQVLVQWDPPTYTQGRGNKQTNVYAVKKVPGDPALPTFEPGVTPLVFSAPETLSIVSLPSELNTRWHVWVKFETRDGVESLVPAGGANGVQDTTGQDIQQLLDVLTGQIREGQLYRALAEPIRSIIRRADEAAEDALRAALAAHQAGQRAKTALLAEAAARGTAITETRQIVAEGDAQLASQLTTLTAAVATNRSEALSAIATETTARASGDTAEATQRETLATQLRGAYTGTDVAMVSSGLIHSERQARSAADSAQVTRLDALEATVNNPVTGVSATASALDVVELTVNSGTSGNAALATRVSSLETTVNNPTTGVAATATALDAVELTVTNASTGNAALGARVSAVEATVNNPASGVTATAAALDIVEAEVLSGPNRNSALASRVGSLESSVNTPSTGLLARATQLEAASTTAATNIGALTTRTSTLEASVNTPTAGNNPTFAALQVEQSARAALDGSVSALYTLRTEVSSGGRTMIGGFGLSATATASAGPRIDFGVRADQFYIAAPAGSGIPDTFPMVVRTTTTTENGVTIPAGVYIDSAYIVNLSAMYARFGTLVADSIAVADINAAKITFGTMSGARITVGTLHGDRIIAGSISAGQIGVSSLSAISANLGTVTAGTLSAGTVFAGALSAATGTFAGDISAASGTFSGALNVRSSASGARLEITTSVIKVFDAAGNVRVRIGDLTA